LISRWFFNGFLHGFLDDFSGWFPVLIFDGFPYIFMKDFWWDFRDGFLNRFLVGFLD